MQAPTTPTGLAGRLFPGASITWNATDLPPTTLGALFVDLAPLSDPGQVPTALGQALVAASGSAYSEAAHLIVYAVICSGVGAGTNRLPFFSLVTFRQAANELRALGYKCAFAWIAKPASTTTKAKRKPKTSLVAIAA